MTKPAVSDKDFIATYRASSSAAEVAKTIGVSERNVLTRRRTLEARYGMALNTAIHATKDIQSQIEQRHCMDFEGVMVVFSDAHFWPGRMSRANKALLRVLPILKPKMINANGDILDGSTISRHHRIGWQKLPKLHEELEETQQRMAEIAKAWPKALRRIQPGNHDMRFDGYLSNIAPSMEGIAGSSLWQHFPNWEVSLSLMLNGNTMIKHRYHSSLHAPMQNALKSGINMVTGHLHRLHYDVWGDYKGHRFGIDTGTLCEVTGPQMLYGEDNPTPGSSGFVVLTFKKGGLLLDPEFARLREDGNVYFRGEAIGIN